MTAEMPRPEAEMCERVGTRELERRRIVATRRRLEPCDERIDGGITRGRGDRHEIGPVVGRLVDAEVALGVLDELRPATVAELTSDVLDERRVHVLARRLRRDELLRERLGDDRVGITCFAVGEDRERGRDNVAARRIIRERRSRGGTG